MHYRPNRPLFRLNDVLSLTTRLSSSTCLHSWFRRETHRCESSLHNYKTEVDVVVFVIKTLTEPDLPWLRFFRCLDHQRSPHFFGLRKHKTVVLVTVSISQVSPLLFEWPVEEVKNFFKLIIGIIIFTLDLFPCKKIFYSRRFGSVKSTSSTFTVKLFRFKRDVLIKYGIFIKVCSFYTCTLVTLI